MATMDRPRFRAGLAGTALAAGFPTRSGAQGRPARIPVSRSEQRVVVIGSEVFDTHFPEQLGYARMDAVSYPRVARMPRLVTAPDELMASDAGTVF